MSVRATRLKRRASRVLRTGFQAIATARTPPRAAYLGHVHRSNIGDEAIFDVVRSILPDLDLESFRNFPPTPWSMRFTQNVRRKPILSHVVLGGGTLVGRIGWHRRLEALLAGRPQNLVTLGVGVEDPDCPVSGKLTSYDELHKWIEALQRFDRISVRGPRSQATLARFGLNAPVSGDPALLWADVLPRAHFQEQLIGFSVADTYAMWGDTGKVFDAIALAGQQLAAQGWRSVVFPFDRADDDISMRLAAHLGNGTTVVPRTEDRLGTIRAIADCHVFVGQRLHSTVLATAANVPNVMLSYRPKCEDFADSIQRTNVSIRTDRLSAGHLIELTQDLAEHREFHSASISEAVEPVLVRLRSEIERMRKTLGFAPEAPLGPPLALPDGNSAMGSPTNATR